MADRLETAEGARAFVDGLVDLLRGMYERVGSIPPIAYVFAQFNPSTQQAHDCEAVPCFSVLADGSELTREQFAHALHGFVEVTHAVGVVFASECWVAFANKGQDLPDDIERYPGRKEGIFLYLEHRRLRSVYGYFAEITRPNGPEGVGVLGAFENVYPFCPVDGPETAVTSKGALANFLKPQM